MTTALFLPPLLPPERVRPGALLLVVALHVGLLWVANLYWPLQSVLFTAVQNTAQSIAVQILQKPTERITPSGGDTAASSATPQAISNPGRLRFGRAEAMLELPASQTEASTPLAGTVQTALAPPARIVASAAPQPKNQPSPTTTPLAKAETRPVAVPERQQPTAVRALDEKLPDPAPIQPPVATPPSSVIAAVPPATPALSVSPAEVAAPVAAQAPVAAATVTPATPATPAPSPSTAASGTVNTATNPGTATATGASLASGSGSALPSAGSAAAPVLSSPGAGGPLNLNLPPRYIYRPPIAVPRRSLSEMANDQLRRKPRDPFAEGIEAAGNMDCLKDTPEGPAQGLLAIGPLLKRAIEEKCRK